MNMKYIYKPDKEHFKYFSKNLNNLNFKLIVIKH